MKILNIGFDDSQRPATVAFEMTVDEAALISALTGSVAPRTVTTALGDVRWGNACFDIPEELSDLFFNRFWDDGVRDVIPMDRLKVVPVNEEG